MLNTASRTSDESGSVQCTLRKLNPAGAVSDSDRRSLSLSYSLSRCCYSLTGLNLRWSLLLPLGPEHPKLQPSFQSLTSCQSDPLHLRLAEREGERGAVCICVQCLW